MSWTGLNKKNAKKGAGMRSAIAALTSREYREQQEAAKERKKGGEIENGHAYGQGLPKQLGMTLLLARTNQNVQKPDNRNLGTGFQAERDRTRSGRGDRKSVLGHEDKKKKRG